ncbi:MAG: glycosyltransferase [Chloroflexota bacterium]|nr:glycosyltransferase [Chloroflexota bacterium]
MLPPQPGNSPIRILLLVPQWPDPPMQGAAIRNLQIALYLAQRHSVTLLTFEAGHAFTETTNLRSICERVEVLPLPTRGSLQRLKTLATSTQPDMAWRLRSDDMWSKVTEVCASERYSHIHVEGIEMATYGLLAAQLMPGAKLTYDAHNAEALLQRRAFTTDVKQWRSLPRAMYSLVQWWRLRRFEKQICQVSRYVLAVSEADLEALKKLVVGHTEQMRLLPNGVEPDYWRRGVGYTEPTMSVVASIVFDGTMDYRPNVDAAVWFAHEVWPLIRQSRRDACFYIVGRNPSPAVTALEKIEGVNVIGPVDDPRGWVAGASVYVVPMRMGGGVRLKVLQAMSMACAIVSTHMGAEGIDVQDGREMLLARSPEEFARSALTLLSDGATGRRLGASARELIKQRYSWENLLPVLDELYPPA